MARKPSHLGSYRMSSPAGMLSALFASIGSSGGGMVKPACAAACSAWSAGVGASGSRLRPAIAPPLHVVLCGQQPEERLDVEPAAGRALQQLLGAVLVAVAVDVHA